MAEKGNVSAEDYDELRSELELLEASKSSKKSSRLPNRLSALRPHCRRVSVSLHDLLS
jgi:hypothetical protein